MKDEEEEKRPTARQALQRFLEIYASLSPEQLQAEVTGSRWKNGESICMALFRALVLNLV